MAVNTEAEKLAKLVAIKKAKDEAEAKLARENKAGNANGDNDIFGNLFGNLRTQDDCIDDNVIAPPKPTPGTFYGMVGDVARIAATGIRYHPPYGKSGTAAT